MTKSIQAVYDGKVLRPESPIDLKPNTRVQIIIEPSSSKAKGKSFLQTAQSLKLNGPNDWSDRFDEYLYGKETDNNE